MLEGLPPYLHRESIIARAISTFGVFLGSVPQLESAMQNLSHYMVAVAVNHLEKVPIELEVYAAGCASVLTIHTKNWIRSPLYSADDLPKVQPKFSKPARQFHPQKGDDSELIHVSRRVLWELCRDIDPSALPEVVQMILNGTTDRREITISESEEMVSSMKINPTTVSLPMETMGEAGQGSHPETETDETTPMSTDEVTQGGGCPESEFPEAGQPTPNIASPNATIPRPQTNQ